MMYYYMARDPFDDNSGSGQDVFSSFQFLMEDFVSFPVRLLAFPATILSDFALGARLEIFRLLFCVARPANPGPLDLQVFKVRPGKLVLQKVSHQYVVHFDGGVEVAKVQVEYQELLHVFIIGVISEQFEIVEHVFSHFDSVIRHHGGRFLTKVQPVQSCDDDVVF